MTSESAGFAVGQCYNSGMSATAKQRDINGNVAATPVAHMLHTVRDRLLTGRGSFQLDDQKIDLSFKDGQIVHAASNDPDQRLGEIMLKEGMIGINDYLASVQAMLETGVRQGEYFVEAGILEPHELKRGIRIQMKEVIYRLLLWEEGTYRFRWGDPAEVSIELTTNLYELILRGMSRCDRFSRLRDVLAPWSRGCAINTEINADDARNIRLKEDETTILGLVNGERTLAEIIEKSPYADIETMQILFGMKWARIIALVDDDEDEDSLF